MKRFALMAFVGCQTSTSAQVVTVPPAATTSAPIASVSAVAPPPPRVAPRLFVAQGEISNHRVCVRRDDTLVCAPSVKGAPSDAVGYAGNIYHECLWTKSGAAYCAGYNRDGRLGLGKKSDDEPLTLVPGIVDVVAMTLSARATCALTKEGAVWCWGDDVTLSPKRVDGVGHVTAIASGAEPHCFLRDDGSIVRTTYLKPSPFPALSSIAALGGCQPSAVCALRRDATVACAATGEFPKEFPITSTPLGALHDIVRVASTATAACALARDGSVRCWGDHGLAPNASLTNARELAAGDRRICALLRSGAVACVDDDADPSAPAKTVIAAP